MSAAVQTRPPVAVPVPKALTNAERDEQATALHCAIQELLIPLIESGNFGSHCTRIVSLLIDFFDEIDQSDNLTWLDATHWIEAMLRGAMNCGDCRPGERASLQAALTMVEPLQALLDCPSWGSDPPPPDVEIEAAAQSAPPPAPAASTIDTTKAARCVLEEIAGSASELDASIFYRGSDKNEADLLNQIMLLREGINRLGMLADIGAGHLGGEQRHTTEQWMLPPIYTDAAGLRNRYS